MAVEMAASGGLLELTRIKRRLERRAEFGAPPGVQSPREAMRKLYRDGSPIARSEVPSSKDQQKQMRKLIDEISLLVTSYGQNLMQASVDERHLYGGRVSDEEAAGHSFLTFKHGHELIALVSNSSLFSLDPLAARLVYTNYTPAWEVELAFDHDDAFRLDIDFLRNNPIEAPHSYSTGLDFAPLENMSREEFVIAKDFLDASKKRLEPLKIFG
jgi:hypothetical protein